MNSSFPFYIDSSSSSSSLFFLEEREEREERERERKVMEANCFLDEFQVPYDEFNVMYRSITSDSMIDFHLTQLSLSSEGSEYSRIPLESLSPYGITRKNHFHSTTTSKTEFILRVEDESESLFVPSKPSYVGSSRISLMMSANEATARIEETLNSFLEVDFKYLKSQSKWDVVHARGSSYCHFEILLFDEYASPSSFLLEGNRLSGDSMSFRLLFNQFKQNLLVARSPHPVTPQLLSLPVTGYSSLSSQSPSAGDLDDPLRSLSPILSMIEPSSPLDIQLEGVRILCDLTMSIEYHGVLVDCCLQRLVSLLFVPENDSCFETYELDSVQQDFQLSRYALFAIANMSTSRPCQDLLVSDQRFLSYLFRQIADGPHTTAEMRRECARTLANLCVGLANKIVRNLGIRYAEQWLETVDSLKDERLRLHATRAKLYIQKCC